MYAASRAALGTTGESSLMTLMRTASVKKKVLRDQPAIIWVPAHYRLSVTLNLSPSRVALERTVAILSVNCLGVDVLSSASIAWATCSRFTTRSSLQASIGASETRRDAHSLRGLADGR